MRKVNKVQRVAKYEEKVIVKRIFWLSVFSVIIIFIIFTVGVNFLGSFADLLGSVFSGNDSSEQSSNIPPPPIVDALPASVNGQSITVSGFSPNAAKVEIYLDSQKVDEMEPAGGRFEFKDFLLRKGENMISLKSYNVSGESSDFSQEVSIVFDEEPPRLEINSPADGEHFTGNNRIKITGETEPDAQVFANGFLANVNQAGEFDVTIPLETEGQNDVEVKAVDEAGNEERVELKLHFQK